MLFNYRIKEISICFFLLFSFNFTFFSQSREIVPNGIVIKQFFKKRITGELIEKSQDSIFVKMKNGEFVGVPKKDILRTKGPHSICLYDNGRFQYRNTLVFNYSIGLKRDPFILEYSISYRIKNNIEFGLGTGFFVNGFQVYTNNDVYFVNVNSRHFYALGKYYFLHKTPIRTYAKIKFGYSNNYSNFLQTSVLKNGYSFSASIGVLFPAKRRIRHFIELGQNISNASGVLDLTGLETKISFDVTFYRFVFTYGIELGRKMKRMNRLVSFF